MVNWLRIILIILATAYAITLQANERAFLVATDFHFDPFASCPLTENPCHLIEDLRNTSPDKWDLLFEQYDKTPIQMGKDSNYLLFKSSLNEIKKQIRANHASFGIILGDYVAHRLKMRYQFFSSDKSGTHYSEFVQHLFDYMKLALQKTDPATTFYHVIGNNDSYHGDYGIETEGVFYLNFIPKSASSDQAKQAGYYAVNLPSDPKVKLIVLNTNLFSQYTKDEMSLKAGTQELDWLLKQLMKIHRAHQKAIIALHIPAGIDVYTSLHKFPSRTIHFWHESDTQRFLQIIKPYSDNIMVILGGHLHKDWFQLLNTTQHKSIIVSGTPAISPIYRNNPAFKIYRYDDKQRELINFTTYYMDLDKLPGWSTEYEFNKVYNSSCQHCAIIRSMQNLNQNGELATYYKMYFAASFPDSDIAKHWLPEYWCAMFHITPTDYQQCIEK